ncbi:PP2C family serine/threonine-protein phosphatase [Micromonospora sp. DT227]|uniref:PP2C family serine/threonine-protein phosphatase n=1 Tax=Micromonospora sp. DT227 TaxID=3393433 RepID=UPI003CF9AE2E
MGTGPTTRTWFGASVCGPAHRRHHVAKQDAWWGITGRFDSLVVVADGLGSRPHSRLGAVAVCRAAHRAVRGLADHEVPDPSRLFARIETNWRVELAHRDPAECSTTVMLSLVHRSGGVLVGQVGDGLIAFGSGHATERLVTERAGFGNETDALGLPGRRPLWRSRWLPSPPSGFRVLLATDGVADDLRPESIGQFIDHLEQEFRPLPPPERHRRLVAELRAWPTPGHFDDKTLALHWTNRGVSACH